MHVKNIILIFLYSLTSKNREMTLEEFKWIWWMEYGHRMWGRLIGAYFYIPAAILWAKGYLSPAMKKRVVVMGALIAAQVNSFLIQFNFSMDGISMVILYHLCHYKNIYVL